MNITRKWASICFLFVTLLLNGRVVKGFMQTPVDITEGFFETSFDGTMHLYISDELGSQNRYDSDKKEEFILDKSLNLGYERGKVWGKFSLTNRTNEDKEVVLQFRKSFLDSLVLYRKDQNNLQLLGNYSWKQSIAERPYPFINPCFVLHLLPKETITYVFKMSKKYGSWHIIPNLYERSYFEGMVRTESMIQLGIFTGFFFMGFIITLSFFFLSRQLVFLFYSFYQISFVLFFLAEIEVLHYFFHDHSLHFLIDEFAYGYYELATYFFYGTFTFLFFRLHIVGHTWIKGLYLIFSAILLISFVLICFFGVDILSQNTFQVYLNYLGLVFLGFIVCNAYYGYIQKIREVIPYLIAQIPILLAAIFWSLSNLSLFPKGQNFTLVFSFSFFLENILMLMALAWILRDYFKQMEKNFTKQIVDVLEIERTEISMNLHDELGGNIATIKRKIEHLLDRKAVYSIFFDELVKTYDIISETSRALRRISHNLAPPELQQVGLVQTLSFLCDSISGSNLRVNFFYTGENQRLPNHVEINLYRIVMEAIQNIQKHAGASLVEVQLTFFEKELNVIISDNGKWKKPDGQGKGLKNIEQRVKYLGGRFVIDYSESGTHLIVELKR